MRWQETDASIYHWRKFKFNLQCILVELHQAKYSNMRAFSELVTLFRRILSKGKWHSVHFSIWHTIKFRAWQMRMQIHSHRFIVAKSPFVHNARTSLRNMQIEMKEKSRTQIRLLVLDYQINILWDQDSYFLPKVRSSSTLFCFRCQFRL